MVDVVSEILYINISRLWIQAKPQGEKNDVIEKQKLAAHECKKYHNILNIWNGQCRLGVI